MGEKFWTLDYEKGFYKEYITIAEEDRQIQIHAIKLTGVLYQMLKDRVIVNDEKRGKFKR